MPRAAGWEAPWPRGSTCPRGWGGGGAGGGGGGGERGDLQRAVRMPRLRREPPRGRPAHVLLQQPPRRVPRVRRARVDDLLRSRPGGPRSGEDDPPGGGRPVEPPHADLLPPDALLPRGPLQVLPRRAVREAPGADQAPRPLRILRGAG